MPYDREVLCTCTIPSGPNSIVAVGSWPSSREVERLTRDSNSSTHLDNYANKENTMYMYIQRTVTMANTHLNSQLLSSCTLGLSQTTGNLESLKPNTRAVLWHIPIVAAHHVHVHTYDVHVCNWINMNLWLYSESAGIDSTATFCYLCSDLLKWNILFH